MTVKLNKTRPSFCNRGRRCHNAIVIRTLQEIAIIATSIRVTKGRNNLITATNAASLAMLRWTSLFKDIEAAGHVGITPANSRYTSAELRHRDRIIQHTAKPSRHHHHSKGF
jgi:hypothetical protein